MNLPRVFFSRKGAFIAMTERNLTMLTDFYEFTMANGYFEKGMGNRRAYFDMFFRRVPDGGGYAIMAGVEQLISYFKNLRFTEEDIAYLRRRKCFSEAFLNYLRDFKFECDVWAVPEGTPVFPGEPLVTVAGPMIQAQFVETMVLLTVHRAMTARSTVRAQPSSAAVRVLPAFWPTATTASRPAARWRIPGCRCSTASTRPSRPMPRSIRTTAYSSSIPIMYSNPVFRTPSAWQRSLLKRASAPRASVWTRAISLISRSRRARCSTTQASPICRSWPPTRSMNIDSFGIGERLITSKSEPVFGGVYKLAAVENEDGEIIPKIKVSENVEKITTPHFKQVYRLFDNKTGKALGDVLTIHDEVIDPALPYVLFHPIHTWKQRVVTDYTVRPLRQQIFKNGECIYQSPSITEIRDYCMREVDTLWDQIKRFENPQTYFVDLSKKLWTCKNELLESCRI